MLFCTVGVVGLLYTQLAGKQLSKEPLAAEDSLLIRGITGMCCIKRQHTCGHTCALAHQLQTL